MDEFFEFVDVALDELDDIDILSIIFLGPSTLSDVSLDVDVTNKVLTVLVCDGDDDFDNDDDTQTIGPF